MGGVMQINLRNPISKPILLKDAIFTLGKVSGTPHKGSSKSCTDRVFVDYDGCHAQSLRSTYGTFCKETLLSKAELVWVTKDGVWVKT